MPDFLPAEQIMWLLLTKNNVYIKKIYWCSNEFICAAEVCSLLRVTAEILLKLHTSVPASQHALSPYGHFGRVATSYLFICRLCFTGINKKKPTTLFLQEQITGMFYLAIDIQTYFVAAKYCFNTLTAHVRKIKERYMEDYTWWREHMKLIFDWKKYFTSERSERVKSFFHKKINFICSSQRVIFFLLHRYEWLEKKTKQK